MPILLDDWSIIVTGSVYEAPELHRSALHGFVTGHPRIPDASPITTSSPVAYSQENDTIFTQSGSEYRLGEVSAQYNARFPDAKSRLVASLPVRHSPKESE